MNRKLALLPFLLLLLLVAATLFFSPSSTPPEVAHPIDTADTAWMLTAAGLVLIMTPGLAFFYGGMVSKKNVISTMLQSYICMAVVTIIWVVVGFSFAFGDSIGGFIGNPTTFFLMKGVLHGKPWELAPTIPLMLFAFYQLKFAIITPALITGAFAERIKFTSYILFISLFCIFIYCPLAHATWHPNGILFKYGVLDFAGGTVVHMSAGIAALVGAMYLKKRNSYVHAPARITYVLLGTGLLWFGWFGFNAGSAVAANGTAGLALLNTIGATTAAVLSWLLVEKIRDGHATSLGAASGVVAGLVAITPACAAVNASGALIIGVVAGALCALSVGLKFKLGFDDSLDVVAVHLVGGIVGTILIGFVGVDVGLFNGGGTDQLVKQVIGAGAVLAYSFIATLIIGKIIDLTIGFRISRDEEIAGIDLAIHAERAYELTDNTQGSVLGNSKGA